MPAPAQPAYVCVGSIIIDDIVSPDGETRMGVLGGGVTHAAAGMLIWGQRAGVCACAGYDLPGPARQRLERDFDLQGVIWLDLPQARAWQIFEWDGRRTELYRVEVLDPFITGPTPEQVPPAYHAAKGVHLLRDGPALPAWRALYPDATLFWEPPQAYMIPEHADEFRAALEHIDIVSPNLLEAQQVYGLADPAALVQAMLDDGARIAALRMGEAGSLVGMRGREAPLAVPAVPVPEVVDQTGAGNTYCGGFLAGWLETGDLVEAACCGAVAASFALEVAGVADPPANLTDLRRRRRDWLRERLDAGSGPEPGPKGFHHGGHGEHRER
jgi:sugar/nucleoside kinase (ribokinase family)